MGMVMILQGDCRQLLAGLPSQSVHCCITSPPYWGLRDYGCAGQMGLEPTPDEYVAGLVAVFREVRRVLRDDGTLWLNLGDSYCTVPHGPKGTNASDPKNPLARLREGGAVNRRQLPGLKHKDLVGIPWLVAFALRADSWYLRSDIIWAKPNPMPESVTDRPTKAHEYLFLLSKSGRYYYDAAAIQEPCVYGDHPRNGVEGHVAQAPGQPAQAGIQRVRRSGNKERQYGGTPGKRPDDHLGSGVPWQDENGRRNRRTVWTVATQPYSEAHFATFPPKLIEPCVLAGCPEDGTILDPFGGAGTVGLVALQHRRSATLLELNPAYCELIRRRCDAVQQHLPLEPRPAGA